MISLGPSPRCSARTAGCRSAALVSMPITRAWGKGERSRRAKSIPGSFTLTVYRAAPVTFAMPSMRGMRLPIVESCAFGVSGGGSSAPMSRPTTPRPVRSMPKTSVSRRVSLDISQELFHFRSRERRFAYLGIAATAAEMAAYGGFHVLERRVGIACKERRAAHHESGGAEPALHGVMLDEGRLHRMQVAVLRQAFDRRDVAPSDIAREHHARADRIPVDPNRTGATCAGIASDLGPREFQRSPKHLGERHARRNLQRPRGPIYFQRQE